MSRWSIVQRISLVVALGALAACSSTAQGEDATGRATPSVSATTGITKIKHVLVLMQENRSYDSYYGHLHDQGQPGSSVEPNTGNPDPVHAGQTITPFKTTQQCTVADLNHSWNGTHQEWDHGKMDGFTAANVDTNDPSGRRAMGYFDKQTLPFYYGLANTFAIADR